MARNVSLGFCSIGRPSIPCVTVVSQIVQPVIFNLPSSFSSSSRYRNIRHDQDALRKPFRAKLMAVVNDCRWYFLIFLSFLTVIASYVHGYREFLKSPISDPRLKCNKLSAENLNSYASAADDSSTRVRIQWKWHRVITIFIPANH